MICRCSKQKIILLTSFLMVIFGIPSLHALSSKQQEVLAEINRIFSDPKALIPASRNDLTYILNENHIDVSRRSINNYFNDKNFTRELPAAFTSLIHRSSLKQKGKKLKHEAMQKIWEIYRDPHRSKPNTKTELALLLQKNQVNISSRLLMLYFQERDFFKKLPSKAKKLKNKEPFEFLLLREIEKIFENRRSKIPTTRLQLLKRLEQQGVKVTSVTLNTYYRNKSFVERLPKAAQNLVVRLPLKSRMVDLATMSNAIFDNHKNIQDLRNRKYRRFHKIQKFDLAEKLGISEPTLSRLHKQEEFKDLLCEHTCKCLEVLFGK